jgi:hypothetical protein
MASCRASPGSDALPTDSRPNSGDVTHVQHAAGSHVLDVNFEEKLPTEDVDIADIVKGILANQEKTAARQKRPLARGTHAKGVCVRATFEVFDLTSTVGEPAMVERLRRGIFAKPGVYGATVRFANGASSVYADSKGDVRSLSFAVDVPAGVLAATATRQDFSMNNAPTFPINDAHAFAALMKIRSAASAAATLKAFLGLSFRDMYGLGQTIQLVIQQQRRPVQPYQRTRYWSTVPFLHGPADAVKYSAIPRPQNAARSVGTGADVLADELTRHLNEDPETSAFDFALQFLDTERMTFRGRRQKASFWIENASVEWSETEAPFHVVGRLTLAATSHLSAAACEATYIDVTENCTPDRRPLGNLNRARWAAESASRKARLAAMNMELRS